MKLLIILCLLSFSSFATPRKPPKKVYEIKNIYTGVSRLFYNATKVIKKLEYLRSKGVRDEYIVATKTIDYRGK